MSDKSVGQASNLIFPLPAILGCIFITLKLCDVIDWSWWWVLSPFWITFIFMILVVVVSLIYFVYKELKNK